MKPIQVVILALWIILIFAVIHWLQQCEKPDRIEVSSYTQKRMSTEISEQKLVWTKTKLLHDGSMIEYFWYDPTGNYPFTKDTCCLDSVVINESTQNCVIITDYDSAKMVLNIEIRCDSLN